ncbi:MAG: right-handed parallel beta-helix repeat-containing protein, partial [Terriglobia bacterium]
GELHPRGSGSPGRIITLADYGSGPLPLIDAGKREAAIELSDQSYWEIRNIETSGGDPYGIWITGNTPRAVVRDVYLKHVVVRDVAGTPAHTSTGLIVFNLQAKGERFEDILVDGATAYNTTEWTGIYISGSPFTSPSGTKGENITVKNCTVHDVGGDGIVIHDTHHALIEHSVAYNTGLIKQSKLPTPNAIWNWDCDDCVVEYNEAYLTHTPGNRHDGAAYDSDYYNRNVTIQYNYAHDADGYCVAVFGSGGKDSNVNTVIRYNICSNDGRNAYLSHQGDFFIHTWNGGSILHARIYNNTSFWNPAASDPYAVKLDADLDPAQPDEFFNNIIYSTVPGFEDLDGPQTGTWRSNHNVFWYAGKGEPRWRKNGTSYSSLAAWHQTSGEDGRSVYADPRLRSPSYHERGRSRTAFTLLPGSPAAAAGWNTGDLGPRDFFGYPVPRTGAVSAGAAQPAPKGIK